MKKNSTMLTELRTRWAAIGAAVAVTLGGGGVMFVDAAKGSGERPVTVMLDEPCRIRDTRPDKAVGGRSAPLGPTEAYPISTQAGDVGDCATKIPADAVGLVTNVTAVDATLNTNLRLYPQGATMPDASNLNPRGGGDPVTNAVTVGLDGSGTFVIRNNKGTVHVIIDVAGFLVDHTHDDRYYTEDEVDELEGRIADLEDRLDGGQLAVAVGRVSRTGYLNVFSFGIDKVRKVGTGRYLVDTSKPYHYPFTHVLLSLDGTDCKGGSIHEVDAFGFDVDVRTYNASGNPADCGFDIATFD